MSMLLYPSGPVFPLLYNLELRLAGPIGLISLCSCTITLGKRGRGNRW